MNAPLPLPVPAIPHHPRELPNDALEAAITTLAASIAAATWRLLSLIAEYDRRRPWGDWSIKSTAHWLNWKCGIALGAAREKVRVARALEALPQIDASFASGEVSYSKVRAMTRVATPENEEYLLMIARHGTASHVERLVQGYRRVQRYEDTQAANRAHASRALSWYHNDDGVLVISARLPAERGALVMKALQVAAEHMETVPAEDDVSAETSDLCAAPAAIRRADALCHIAEQFLAQGNAAAKSADRYQIMIHVDREGLREDGEPTRCAFEHGPGCAAETARRLACDASVVEIMSDPAGEALTIGRRTRTVPPAIRRALQARDAGCRFPGCTNHRYVDAHHIRHWADGGETSVRNLVLLCRSHHRALHEAGFHAERRDDGRLLFFRPDGRAIPDAPQIGPATREVAAVLGDEGVHVSAETCVPKWGGERMDLHLAVFGLVQIRDRAEAGATKSAIAAQREIARCQATPRWG